MLDNYKLLLHQHSNAVLHSSASLSGKIWWWSHLKVQQMKVREKIFYNRLCFLNVRIIWFVSCTGPNIIPHAVGAIQIFFTKCNQIIFWRSNKLLHFITDSQVSTDSGCKSIHTADELNVWGRDNNFEKFLVSAARWGGSIRSDVLAIYVNNKLLLLCSLVFLLL